MWVARNRTGELRCFEMPPRRFHSGSTLSSEKTGFNDAVYIDDGSEDTYSFWAVQKYYESNRIEGKEYGFRLMKTVGTDTWGEYEPEWCKDIKWEDEPVEVGIFPETMVLEVKGANRLPFICHMCPNEKCIFDLMKGDKPTCIHFDERIEHIQKRMNICG